MLMIGDRFCFVCFCKLKTAYESRISDWSSDVCTSDLEFQNWTAAGDKSLKQIEQQFDGRLALSPQPKFNRIQVCGSPKYREEALSRLIGRSEERRVGKECVSTCRSRW